MVACFAILFIGRPFNSIQVPEFATFASNFLLHDVGTGDGIPRAAKLEFLDQSTANKFRTPPLCGLRFRQGGFYPQRKLFSVFQKMILRSHIQGRGSLTQNKNARALQNRTGPVLYAVAHRPIVGCLGRQLPDSAPVEVFR